MNEVKALGDVVQEVELSIQVTDVGSAYDGPL